MRKGFFGQYLVSQGYITPPQLLAAVEYQTKYNTRLGELAVALGMLTPFESEQINAAQLWDDELFGETAVRCGVLTERQVDEALETQRNSRVLLGQALEKLGYLGRPTLDDAHAAFLREEDESLTTFALPSELQDVSWIGAVFDRAGKLLRRAWDLPNKPGRVRIGSARLVMSDRNARAQLLGRVERELRIGLPDDVARKAARIGSGDDTFGDSVEDHAVQDFARVLAEASVALLMANGDSAYLARVTRLDGRVSLPPGERVVMVSFLTHLGQVLVGLTI